MPGPVSDSYDPEFSTAANASAVREGIKEVIAVLTALLGDELHDIVGVAYDEGKRYRRQLKLTLTERRARLARFGLLRVLDTL